MKKLLCMLLCLCTVVTAPLTLASCQILREGKDPPPKKDPADCTHTVTFMANGAVYTVLGYDELPSKLDMPTFPAKKNAAFAGWYEDAESREKPFDPARWLQSGGKITVYAAFERAYLIPMCIEATTFKEKIMEPLAENAGIDNRDYMIFMAYFSMKKYATEAYPAKKEAMGRAYPITAKKNIDIYIFNQPNVSHQILSKLEAFMKQYCPDYTFEDLAEDHSYVEYLAKPLATDSNCTHTITFMANGAVYSVLGYDELPSKLDMPTFPAKENAAFAGWYEDAESREKPFDPTQWLQSGGKITVYAAFERAYLIPMCIEATTFKEKIMEPLAENAGIDNRDYIIFMAYFSMKKYATEAYPAKKEAMGRAYPITAKKNIDIYIFNQPNASHQDLSELEAFVKQYCPDYTFEDLAEDHSYVEYLAKPLPAETP